MWNQNNQNSQNGGNFQNNQNSGNYQNNNQNAGNYQNPSPGRQQNGKVYNEKLQQLFNWGFPSNHLLTVGVSQRIPNITGGNQRQDLKEKIICFVTLAPGAGAGSDRTYDFQQKISQKFSTREIGSLADILYQCAVGNDVLVLPYSKFSNSTGQSKTLSVWVSQKQTQIAGNVVNVRNINITISYTNKYTISMTCDQAFGMAKILNKLFDRAIECELDIQRQNPMINFDGNSSNNNNQSFSQSPQTGGMMSPGFTTQPSGNVSPGFTSQPINNNFNAPTSTPSPVPGFVLSNNTGFSQSGNSNPGMVANNQNAMNHPSNQNIGGIGTPSDQIKTVGAQFSNMLQQMN